MMPWKPDFVLRMQGEREVLEVHGWPLPEPPKLESVLKMSLDQDIARAAAEQANRLFGQWMPERWLNLFIDSYDDIDASRKAPRYSEEECPGHVGSKNDPKVCGNCGIHSDSLRPPDNAEAF